MEEKTIYILGVNFNVQELHKMLDEKKYIYIARNRWIHKVWKNIEGEIMTVLYLSRSEDLPRFTRKNHSEVLSEEFIKNLLESEDLE